MPKQRSILADLSTDLAAQTTAASAITVAIGTASGSHLSGTLWRPDIVVTSAQSLPPHEEYEISATNHETLKATLAGRDPATNIAALRLDRAVAFTEPQAVEATRGSIALALGAAPGVEASVRLGIVNFVGAEWRSRWGGRIERRIVIDTRLAHSEEGGPVVDVTGGLLGISTFGPHGQVLVIPSATIARVVPQLLRDGYIARGWLGVELQPVAVPESLQESAGSATAMMVMSMDENGPAVNAGLTAGDLLLKVDGVPASGSRKLAATLDADSIGRAIELLVIRGGAITPFRATVASRPRDK
jgi:S1-C subfamily serine protease